jgi:hypothetical protein
MYNPSADESIASKARANAKASACQLSWDTLSPMCHACIKQTIQPMTLAAICDSLVEEGVTRKCAWFRHSLLLAIPRLICWVHLGILQCLQFHQRAQLEVLSRRMRPERLHRIPPPPRPKTPDYQHRWLHLVLKARQSAVLMSNGAKNQKYNALTLTISNHAGIC